MMIVEDGLGLTNSNSYVDLVFADDYFSARGIEFWAGLTDEQKEFALINATDYVDSAFDWNGIKKTQEQSLRFPRENLIDSDGYKVEGIPAKLKEAVCESALKLSQNVELFQTEEANGAVTSERIGELSFTYDNSKKAEDKSLYDAINLRLRGLFRDKSKNKIIMGNYSK